MAEESNVANLDERRAQVGFRQQQRAPLNPTGGGGTSGGMEARVAKLESDMEHVKKGVDRLERDFSDMKQSLADMRVDNTRDFGAARERLVSLEAKMEALPTKDWITTRLQAYLGIMVAVSAIAIGITKLI